MGRDSFSSPQESQNPNGAGTSCHGQKVPPQASMGTKSLPYNINREEIVSVPKGLKASSASIRFSLGDQGMSRLFCFSV